MQSQKTSFIKRTGQAARRQFQVIHLAVFPFQVEFLKQIEYPITAYFQKGNQILGVNGESPITWRQGEKGERVRLANPSSTVRFHLYSESNVVYKWSLYRQHPSGEQEFLESCAFNLKEVVTNFILPHRDSSQSFLVNDFHQKQLRGKFGKTGIILSFALILANDDSLIDSCVLLQYCQATVKAKSSDQAIEISNGQAVHQEPELPQEDSFQSASMLSEPFLPNDSAVSRQNPESRRKLTPQPHRHSESILANEPKEDQNIELYDLDHFIINGEQEQVFVLPPPNIQQEEDAANVEESDKPKLKVQGTRKLRHSNSRDYSMLRLDSNQGRQEVEEIDARLGKQEDLDLIIEEQGPSLKGSPQFPKPTHKHQQTPKMVKQARESSKPSQIDGGLNLRRLLLFLIVMATGLLVGAIYKYSVKKEKKSRSR